MTTQARTSPAWPTPRWLRRIIVTSRRSNVFPLIEGLCVAWLLAMAGSAYVAFSTAPAGGELLPTRQVALLLMGALIPAIGLLVLLGRRLALRRAAGSTARLHVRLVFLFSLIAAVPTLLVAGFAAVLFQSGVDFWFSNDSRGLMANANRLAENYYTENQEDVANNTIAMASDLRFYLERVSLVNENWPTVFRYQAEPRDITESAILQQQKDGSLRTAFVYGLASDNDPANFVAEALPTLAGGQLVVVRGGPVRIESVAPIDRDTGIYLYTARNAEAESFQSWETAKSIASAYDVLIGRARALQLRFNLALFFVSLALVGFAVWFALRFADRQVEPLTDLVLAARKVGAGNFSLRMEGRQGGDEIGLLNRAFNRMTAQLEKQTDALVGANRQLEERRGFIEAVIQSVSAGVLSLDPAGGIQLMNAPARAMLGAGEGDTLHIDEVAPQIAAMVAAGLRQGVISHSRAGELLTLAVKIAPEKAGHVVTFEDITRQLLDQRRAAWSDVARRIAHEIKNPLTPIQLATERLRRRYRKQIAQDGELFDELTSTIVRQVGDLRKMVDEFSSFARLPKPVFRPEDALDLVRQALFLQEVAHPVIAYELAGDTDAPMTIACDRHQFGQAMTNVLKNAAEAIEARQRDGHAGAEPDYRGRITVTLQAEDDALSVVIEDNGIGLPQDRERIVEPYVTTREKGTGLGLAIVTKIVEEHGGDMIFTARPEGGTSVTLHFARDPNNAVQTSDKTLETR